MLRIGLSKVDITPRRSVSLAGYFNDRKSRGILDRLYARTLLLSDNKTTLCLINLDLLGLADEDVDIIQQRLKRKFSLWPQNIFISSTHTHTAPAPFTVFGARREKRYIKELFSLIEKAVKIASERMAEGEIHIARIREKGLSFNRRYFMKGGKVLTNPPKGSPDIIKPEGPVDNLITSLIFTSGRRIKGMLVQATNHVDTIGGNLISADWPGHLARELNKKLEGRFPVLVLTGTAGNINHYNPYLLKGQSSYAESRRIGQAYAGLVVKSLAKKSILKTDRLSAMSQRLSVPYRKVSSSEIKEAGEILKVRVPASSKDLTSEDLAKGDILVKRLFSGALLDFVKAREKEKKGTVNITVFKIGELAVIGLPGEPFVEIGLAIKKKSRFPYTLVTGNTNGEAGYIPLKKHFQHGGYETATHLYNRFSEDLGKRIIRESINMLKKGE